MELELRVWNKIPSPSEFYVFFLQKKPLNTQEPSTVTSDPRQLAQVIHSCHVGQVAGIFS